jgi:hypothetical protein
VRTFSPFSPDIRSVPPMTSAASVFTQPGSEPDETQLEPCGKNPCYGWVIRYRIKPDFLAKATICRACRGRLLYIQ